MTCIDLECLKEVVEQVEELVEVSLKIELKFQDDITEMNYDLSMGLIQSC